MQDIVDLFFRYGGTSLSFSGSSVMQVIVGSVMFFGITDCIVSILSAVVNVGRRH